MGLWLIIIIGAAFVGTVLTVRTVARSKLTSERMLQEYHRLLEETRRGKDDEDEAGTEPPAAEDG